MPQSALKTYHLFLAFQTESYARKAMSVCIPDKAWKAAKAKPLPHSLLNRTAGLYTSRVSVSCPDKLSSTVGSENFLPSCSVFPVITIWTQRYMLSLPQVLLLCRGSSLWALIYHVLKKAKTFRLPACLNGDNARRELYFSICDVQGKERY